MKNFDHDRQRRATRPASERTFVLGGETFMLRARVPANVMTQLDEITSGQVSPGRVLDIVTGVVTDMVEPPGGEKWRELVARGAEEDPLTLADVIDVVQWLIENETNIPTSEPSPSGDGSVNPVPGAPLTDASPSPALTPTNSPVDVFSGQPTPG
ncbi:MAG TPA: hypothetical protein VNG35_06125 [Gemmatimonadales bacterium]|nr:hypothetical protein [Gemmatimonadales bacterium]